MHQNLLPLTMETTMLKIIILILLIAMLISLASGAVFFFKDQGRSKRTLYALGIRVTLAVLLIACVTYGVLSGQLQLNAPWHQGTRAAVTPEASPETPNVQDSSPTQ